MGSHNKTKKSKLVTFAYQIVICPNQPIGGKKENPVQNMDREKNLNYRNFPKLVLVQLALI